MADIADIEKAIVARLTAALMPAGYASGPAATSLIGPKLRVYRGWPVAVELDADLLAGIGHVTVYPLPNMSRLTTRFRTDWFTVAPSAPTMTATIYSNTVTFAGSGAAGQVAGIYWEGVAVAYRMTAADTPATVAAALAAQITGASVSGAVVTLPNDADLAATVVADQSVMREVRRQQQGIKVSVWAPTPAARDLIGAAADAALAAMETADGSPTQFITLGTGEAARVQYRGTVLNDRPGKAHLWRRDIDLTVEYGTTQVEAQPAVLFPTPVIRAGGLPVGPAFLNARPAVGAIRWDGVWGADALASAEAAALSPSQFQYRAPFWASVSGSVTFPTLTQAIMDAEIAAAVAAKLDFWAFVGWPTGAPQLAARNLYLSSAIKSQLGFCLIEIFSNLAWHGAAQPEFADAVALTGQATYQRVNGRPLMFLLDSGDTDINSRFGGRAALARWVALLRSQIAATAGANPYLVVMAPYPWRAAALARDCGFDAISAYAVPQQPITPTPYATLAAQAAAIWPMMASTGWPVIPPAMAGWNPTPRAVTPSSYFGTEANGLLSAYYQDGTASDIAAHVAAARAWVRANPGAAPAQAAIVYAWNEFTEGGIICPTYSAGNPGGDTSRVTALGSALA